MNAIIAFFLGLFFGGILGLMVTAIVVAGKDDEHER